MMRSRWIPKRCGLRKLSDDLKNSAAGKFRASIPRMPLGLREKLSSDEGHLPSRSARGNDRISRFYEGRSEGFGPDFLTAVEATARRIEQFPEAGPIDRANLRKRLYLAFLSRFFTKYSLIASSSQPLCINIAGLVIGGNACRH